MFFIFAYIYVYVYKQVPCSSHDRLHKLNIKSYPSFHFAVPLYLSIWILFQPSATQEILEELRPLICPYDYNLMAMTMRILRTFLPTMTLPEHHSITHDLWFEEMMTLWKNCHSSNYPWQTNFMQLMAFLAMHNVGYIDWEPHLPFIFTKIIKNFNLPVSYKKSQKYRVTTFKGTLAAVWIVSTLVSHAFSMRICWVIKLSFITSHLKLKFVLFILDSWSNLHSFF